MVIFQRNFSIARTVLLDIAGGENMCCPILGHCGIAFAVGQACAVVSFNDGLIGAGGNAGLDKVLEASVSGPGQ